MIKSGSRDPKVVLIAEATTLAPTVFASSSAQIARDDLLGRIGTLRDTTRVTFRDAALESNHAALV